MNLGGRYGGSVDYAVLIIAIIAFIAIVIIYVKPFGGKEDLSYSFGFPTHGDYNYGGGPLRGGWPNMWWPRRRLWRDQYYDPYGGYVY